MFLFAIENYQKNMSQDFSMDKQVNVFYCKDICDLKGLKIEKWHLIPVTRKTTSAF